MSDLEKGWVAFNASQKWHYIKRGRSLCGRFHVHTSQAPPASPKHGHYWNVIAYSDSVDDPSKQCATCTTLLRSEEARILSWQTSRQIEAQKKDEKEKEAIAAFFRDPPLAFTRNCKDCGQCVTVTTPELVEYVQHITGGVSLKLIYTSALERGESEWKDIKRLGIVSLTPKEAYRQYSFDLHGPKGVFCKKCRSPDWNPFRSKGRSTSANARWKLAVRRRDGNKCVQCGSRVALDVHHIKPWATFHDLRYDVNNGQTLCANCHDEMTYGNRRPWNVRYETTSQPCVDCGFKSSRMGLYRKGSLERLRIVVPVIDVGIDRRLQYDINDLRKQGYDNAEIEAILKEHEKKVELGKTLREIERQRQISECEAVCANCHRLRVQNHKKKGGGSAEQNPQESHPWGVTSLPQERDPRKTPELRGT